MDKPVWLLDFDGVVNAITRKPDRNVHGDWVHTSASAEGRQWPIWYSPTVTQLIGNAAVDKGVDVVWLSTWGPYTAALPDKLDSLPHLPYLSREAAGDDMDGCWWKLRAAQHFVAHDRPLLWTDDDLNLHPEADKWIRGRGRRTEAISPNAMTGLVPRHVRIIREFLDSYTF